MNCAAPPASRPAALRAKTGPREYTAPSTSPLATVPTMPSGEAVYSRRTGKEATLGRAGGACRVRATGRMASDTRIETSMKTSGWPGPASSPSRNWPTACPR
jgi:hypothetical protein